MAIEVDKLYQTRNPSRRMLGDKVAIRLAGVSVSITVYGSDSDLPPENISDMADIASDDSPFTVADWYSFEALPRWIAFAGTVTDIEVSNVALDLYGDIS